MFERDFLDLESKIMNQYFFMKFSTYLLEISTKLQEINPEKKYSELKIFSAKYTLLFFFLYYSIQIYFYYAKQLHSHQKFWGKKKLIICYLIKNWNTSSNFLFSFKNTENNSPTNMVKIITWFPPKRKFNFFWKFAIVSPVNPNNNIKIFLKLLLTIKQTDIIFLMSWKLSNFNTLPYNSKRKVIWIIFQKEYMLYATNSTW
jgi:hypothetical protein